MSDFKKRYPDIDIKITFSEAKSPDSSPGAECWTIPPMNTLERYPLMIIAYATLRAIAEQEGLEKTVEAITKIMYSKGIDLGDMEIK